MEGKTIPDYSMESGINIADLLLILSKLNLIIGIIGSIGLFFVPLEELYGLNIALRIGISVALFLEGLIGYAILQAIAVIIVNIIEIKYLIKYN